MLLNENFVASLFIKLQLWCDKLVRSCSSVKIFDDSLSIKL
jgi:hypothetical protein